MKILIYLIFYCFLGLVVSCTKGKVPQTLSPDETTKYEKIKGVYKVYDCDFNYLHNLTIAHAHTLSSNGFILDSLYFNGFDGQFCFSVLQSSPTNPESYFISLGYHNMLIDSLGNRWKIIAEYDANGIFNNVYHKDTIKLIYRKTNINYWIEDATPYLDTIIKQVAVKQQ
jgi:hypothetical protein